MWNLGNRGVSLGYDFNPLVKLTDEEPESHRCNSGCFSAYFAGAVGGNKQLLFNRYRELFVSHWAEVTPAVRKTLKCTWVRPLS